MTKNRYSVTHVREDEPGTEHEPCPAPSVQTPEDTGNPVRMRGGKVNLDTRRVLASAVEQQTCFIPAGVC